MNFKLLLMPAKWSTSVKLWLPTFVPPLPFTSLKPTIRPTLTITLLGTAITCTDSRHGPIELIRQDNNGMYSRWNVQSVLAWNRNSLFTHYYKICIHPIAVLLIVCCSKVTKYAVFYAFVFIPYILKRKSFIPYKVLMTILSKIYVISSFAYKMYIGVRAW